MVIELAEPLKLAAHELLPVQRATLKALKRNARRIHMAGSFRGGKTVAALLTLVLHSTLRNGASTYVCVGVSKDAFVRNCLAYLEDIADWMELPCKPKPDDGYIIIADAVFYIFGGYNKQSAGFIQGLTADGALLDEVALQPRTVYDMVTTRLSRTNPLLITTANPMGPRHWYKTQVLDRAAETGDVVIEEAKTGIDDNIYIDDQLRADLEMSLPEHMKARGLLGNWVAAEGLVYPLWYRYEGDGAAMRPPVVGVDYGRGRIGITAAVAIDHITYPYAFPPKRPVYAATREYWHEGPLDPNIHAERLVKMFPGAYFVVDPSPAHLYQPLLARAPGRVKKADKGPGSLIRTVTHVESMLASGHLLIGDCPNLQTEMLSYVWNEQIQTGFDRPIKENDHALDALRYALDDVLDFRESDILPAHIRGRGD